MVQSGQSKAQVIDQKKIWSSNMKRIFSEKQLFVIKIPVQNKKFTGKRRFTSFNQFLTLKYVRSPQNSSSRSARWAWDWPEGGVPQTHPSVPHYVLANGSHTHQYWLNHPFFFV